MGGSSQDPEENEPTIDKVPATLTKRLYVSHFLSTWNSRVFEFGAVLYLASIFPKTLLPLSVYALARGASAIVFSPAVGRYIDTANRLRVVRLSIGKSPLCTGRYSLGQQLNEPS
jgi:iron-regulated transporter 1